MHYLLRHRAGIPVGIDTPHPYYPSHQRGDLLMHFATHARTYSVELPDFRLFADDRRPARMPYDLVRTVPCDRDAVVGGRLRACPYLAQDNPLVVMWVRCITPDGDAYVLEIRGADGKGIARHEFSGDAPQIMRVLFDHGRSLLPIPGVVLKLKPTP